MIEDRIDQFELAWTEAYPDLDPWPLRILGRISRLAGILEKQGEGLRKSYGLSLGEIQVLAALRRVPEFTTSPKDLAQLMLVTSAAITSRLNSLELKGFLTRCVDVNSRRRILVTLTPKGAELIESYIREFVIQRSAITDALSPEDRENYANSLRQLLLIAGDGSLRNDGALDAPELEPL